MREAPQVAGPSQTALNQDEQFFTNPGFSIFSWQYALDDNPPGSGNCNSHNITYDQAQQRANNPVINEFDK